MNALSPIARPITDIARDMGSAVARMIAIQMEAYPEHWTEQERREARKHVELAGRKAAA